MCTQLFWKKCAGSDSGGIIKEMFCHFGKIEILHLHPQNGIPFSIKLTAKLKKKKDSVF